MKKKKPTFFERIEYSLLPINSSKLLLGITVLLVNIGSKYVDFGLNNTQEKIIRKILTRQILIFAMIFLTTQNLILSLLLTSAFEILSSHMLNFESPYCILPKNIIDIIDSNNDNQVSKEEQEKAINILQKAIESRN